MRCPKCHYISFDSGERCRNCGYDFSLSPEDSNPDLPIASKDAPEGPLGDFALEASLPAVPRAPDTASDLPLFARGTADRPAAVQPAPPRHASASARPVVAPPRAPLSVRRSSPAVARERLREEPTLDLGLPQPPAGKRREAVVSAEVPEEEADPTAPLLRRLAAGLIDVVLIGAIHAAVIALTLRLCGLTFAQLRVLPPVPLATFLLMLAGGYFITFTVAGGQTIGKMAAGVRVVPIAERDPGSARVTLGSAVVRAVGCLVSILTGGLGVRPGARQPRPPCVARSARRYARRAGVTRLAVFIATAGYCGYFPVAPGTVGSLAGLAAYLLVWWSQSAALEVCLIAVLFAAGVWAGTIAERFFGGLDPGPVVIDEVVGMLITLAFIPVGLSGAIAGFVLFRVFDVIKPYPAGRLERLHGGLGVMADDVMAAVYANVALRAVLWAFPGWVS